MENEIETEKVCECYLNKVISKINKRSVNNQ